MKRSPASFRSRSKPGNLELPFKMADNNKSQTDGRAQLVSAKGRYSGVILALPTFTTGVTTILVSRVISPLLLPLPPMHTPSHALFLRARSLQCPLCESAISWLLSHCRCPPPPQQLCTESSYLFLRREKFSKEVKKRWGGGDHLSVLLFSKTASVSEPGDKVKIAK